MQAMEVDPLDATLFANQSLCWLRLGEGELALPDAQRCRALHPRWAKAWYREGTALGFLKVQVTSLLVYHIKFILANEPILISAPVIRYVSHSVNRHFLVHADLQESSWRFRGSTET